MRASPGDIGDCLPHECTWGGRCPEQGMKKLTVHSSMEKNVMSGKQSRGGVWRGAAGCTLDRKELLAEVTFEMKPEGEGGMEGLSESAPGRGTASAKARGLEWPGGCRRCWRGR